MSDNGIVGFRGDVFTPDDAGYDEARSIFNAMIDRRPAVIAQCGSPRDVMAALAFGREASLEVSVRGGGHSVAGQALDRRRTRSGHAADQRRLGRSRCPHAHASAAGRPGVTSTGPRQPYGLAATGGRVSTTGVGGPDARRRLGLAGAEVRPRLRQPDLGRSRHRGRAAGDRERGGEPRAVLGAPRGRRQLRDRDLVRPSGCTSPTFTAGAAALAARARARGGPRATASSSRRRRTRSAAASSTSPGRPRSSSRAPAGQLALGVGVMYAGGEAEAREAAAPLLDLSRTVR